jgi:hypothetical protein
VTIDEAIDRVHRQHTALRAAVDHSLGRAEILPALIVMYAGIDGMAWLARPAGVAHKPGQHFKDYVEKFVLRPTDEVTPSDLWAARCAILHTQTPESDLSRTGNAREIWYRLSDGRALVQLFLNKPQLPLTINPAGLAAKWTKGVDRHLADVATAPAGHPEFARRAEAFTDPAVIDPPQSPTSPID